MLLNPLQDKKTLNPGIEALVTLNGACSETSDSRVFPA